MIIAGDNYAGNHNAHARGVAAILRIENSPLDLFGAVHCIRSCHQVVSNGPVQVRTVLFLSLNLKQSLTRARTVEYFPPRHNQATVLKA
jgi:hypothetical protein